VKPPQQRDPELEVLVGLFYSPTEELGLFEEVTAESLPADTRSLLAHENHMTVTVEAFHGTPVNVEVLATARNDELYSRQILLRRSSDNLPVQYGIVQLDFQHLAEKTQAEIVAQSAPLGRILIQHGVLRKVQLTALWRIQPSDQLRDWLQMPPNVACHGRTALIYCDGQPAVELLEVIPPSAADLEELRENEVA
jgi:chorismate-pyruvate lyase